MTDMMSDGDPQEVGRSELGAWSAAAKSLSVYSVPRVWHQVRVVPPHVLLYTIRECRICGRMSTVNPLDHALRTTCNFVLFRSVRQRLVFRWIWTCMQHINIYLLSTTERDPPPGHGAPLVTCACGLQRCEPYPPAPV